MKKISLIELIEFNFLMSLIDFFTKEFEGIKVNNKDIRIVQSYFDKHLAYHSPAFSVELLYRRNRSVGFNNFVGEIESDDKIIEIDGVTFEYRVQLNVYSNTRGEVHKWNSILEDILFNGGINGIPLNVYYDNGSIKQEKVGIITYDYSSDVRNNNSIPNTMTYDFHTIYDTKMKVIQQYKIIYDIAEIGDVSGNLKLNRGEF